MIRTLIVATSLALAANAFAAGAHAPAPAPAPRMAPMAAQQPVGDWHNSVHPIRAGTGGDQSTMAATEVIQGTSASKDTTADGGWHNTVHPVPAGNGGDGTTQRTATNNGATTNDTADGGWHNSVHPIPAGDGGQKSKSACRPGSSTCDHRRPRLR